MIVIESAVYGRSSRDVCTASDTTSCGVSLLPQIQEKCFRKQACNVNVQPSMISPEPCPHTPKYLNLTYECLSEDKIHTIGKETNIRDSWGYLVSPNYPRPYDNGVHYQTDFGESSINVRLLDLAMEARATKGCYDWLVLSDSVYIQHTYDYCGSVESVKEPLTLSINNFHVSFRVDSANSYRGFLIKFQADSWSGYTATSSLFNASLISGVHQVQLLVVLSVIVLIWLLRRKNFCGSIKTWLTARARWTKLI